MSTQNRSLIVGLVTPGIFWLAASVAQGQDSPSPQGLPSIPVPASPMTYSVLLMSNGTVVKGEIIDDPAGAVYRLKTRGGQVPYPKSSVKRAGHSVEELYRYQVAALPPGDGDERMKLVRWCLTEQMPKQAREQLTEVLKLCPDDTQASRMADNLDANAEHQNRDPALRQTSGNGLEDEAPASLPPGLAKTLRKGFGNNLPEIFDLPPALAITRASEFAQYVQPVLQQNCANCHNEKYQGDFQLVLVKNRRDQQNTDIVRGNLDAVLRLVNPDDPARSELLSAGLVPHGNKGAIFRGANDRQYRVLSTWVRSIRPGTSGAKPSGKAGGLGGEGVTQAGYSPADSGDGFASDRSRRSGPGGVSTGLSAEKTPAYPTPGANRTVNEYNESADFSRGVAGDFPLPFAVGGKEASQPAPGGGQPKRSAQVASLPPLPKTKPAVGRGFIKKADPDAAMPETPAITPTTAIPVGQGAVAVEVGGHPNDLPGMNQPKYPTMPKAETTAADDDDEAPLKPAPAKKKPKVDPALLEQMIKARNAGNP